MRIGILLPSTLASNTLGKNIIFAPLGQAVILADTLTHLGHTVYFYSSRDVKTKATVVPGDFHLTDDNPVYDKFRLREYKEDFITTHEIIKRDFEFHVTMLAYQDALQNKLDVIHSYHDFGAHYFNELTHFPTLYTLHDPLPMETNTIEYLRYSKFAHHNYISISNSQRKSAVKLNFIKTIYHGLDLNTYPFNNSPEDYYIYFGRMVEDKGVDIAVQIARETKIKLVIATSLETEGTSAQFFENKIKPYVDNINIIVKDFMKKEELNEIIKKARAFIFPLQWDEPFGLTVIEAMACGTPVIAFNHGSMSELIEDKVTGFIIEDTNQMEGFKQAIKNIDSINRKHCRDRVTQLFTNELMAQNYLDAYKKII